MIKRKESCASALDTMIGCLGNTGMILCQICHFLSRHRELHKRAMNRRSIKLNNKCIKDLELMLYFLGKVNKDIDLNMVVYRKPTHIYRSDSCPAGMGGYSHEGFC